MTNKQDDVRQALQCGYVTFWVFCAALATFAGICAAAVGAPQGLLLTAGVDWIAWKMYQEYRSS